MRRHQLFAAAVSVALLVGGAAPALATPGKAKAKGHDKPAAAPKPNPAKPAKGLRVNGGGTTAGGARFSVEVRSDHPKKGQKGHFNYTKEAVAATATTAATPVVKIRCKTVSVAPAAPVQTGDKAATVTGTCREGEGKATTPVSVRATFYDNAAGDRADIVFTRNGVDAPPDSGAIQGNVHVR